MKTTLQKITAKAKQIRKAKPSMKWTDCIKAASKQLGSGTKKTSVKKVVRKKTVLVGSAAPAIKSISGLKGELKKRLGHDLGSLYVAKFHARTKTEKKQLQKKITSLQSDIKKLG